MSSAGTERDLWVGVFRHQGEAAGVEDKTIKDEFFEYWPAENVVRRDLGGGGTFYIFV